MDFSGLSWVTITVIGAAALAIIIAFASLRNRVSKGTEARSEAATRENYREEDRAHQDESDSRL